VKENGRLDIVIHNAGYMIFGSAEDFTPDPLAELYDVNVLSTQRVNRAALAILRRQGKGLVAWVGNCSTRGEGRPTSGHISPPKPAWTRSRSATRANWPAGISKPSWSVLGASTSGTNHFTHAGSPDDKTRLSEYKSGPRRVADQIMKGFELIAPAETDAAEVARAIVKVVSLSFGTRPF